MDIKITPEKALEILEKERTYMMSHGGDIQVAAYDVAITAIKERQNIVTLTDEEIKIFQWYIDDNDMPTAFGNSDWFDIYTKITKGKITEKIRCWLDRLNPT